MRPVDWYWEGNVQTRLVEFLKAAGWTITREANTATGERGADVLAERDGRTLVAEVIGYPLPVYAHGHHKAGQPKRTRQPTQARRWFDRVLTSAITRRIRYGPDAVLVITLPDLPTYRRLLAKAEWALERLGIGVYLVAESGDVTLLSDHSG